MWSCCILLEGWPMVGSCELGSEPSNRIIRVNFLLPHRLSVFQGRLCWTMAVTDTGMGVFHDVCRIPSGVICSLLRFFASCL
jgi:hypothetical protein